MAGIFNACSMHCSPVKQHQITNMDSEPQRSGNPRVCALVTRVSMQVVQNGSSDPGMGEAIREVVSVGDYCG
jgi:hypothetical protein